MWCAPCGICCGTSPARSRCSGTARPFTGRAVKQFLADGGARRLQLEQLPGYAPDLNADEGIWN
ncbi:MAG TPA: hypothetical protein VFL91_08625 [Thermomicrobiales bacterium]|nr:hypothetical protein [Thermomicrobiales bacterium]